MRRALYHATADSVRSGNQAQRDIFWRRPTHRPVALAVQPILEVGVVQANDASDLEHRQWIGSAAGHIAAPALRASKGRSDAFPGLDEIRHCSSVCLPHCAEGMPGSDLGRKSWQTEEFRCRSPCQRLDTCQKKPTQEQIG